MSTVDVPPGVFHPGAIRMFSRAQYEQRTPAWYEVRRGLITASDAASALGIPPYKSYRGDARADALRKKLDNVPLRNMFVAHGQRYEPEAIAKLSEAMDETIHEFGLVVHDLYPWLGASPDGVTSSGKLVEIKAPMKREIVPGHVPSHYMPQIQVQLEVCDLDQCIFCQYKPSALTGGEPIVDIVVVERDRLWFENNCTALYDFWKDYTTALPTHVPPPLPPPPQCLIVDDLYDS